MSLDSLAQKIAHGDERAFEELYNKTEDKYIERKTQIKKRVFLSHETDNDYIKKL